MSTFRAERTDTDPAAPWGVAHYYDEPGDGLGVVHDGIATEPEAIRMAESLTADAAASDRADAVLAGEVAPSLIERLDAALALDEEATALHEEQNRYEEEEGPRPSGWQGVDEAHIEAGDAALDVLRAVRPLLAAIASFAERGDASHDVATRLTCGEVDDLALILARAGHTEEAAGWISDHAQPSESDEGDVADDSAHHAVWAAYDALDEWDEAREAADAAATAYLRAELLTETTVTG